MTASSYNQGNPFSGGISLPDNAASVAQNAVDGAVKAVEKMAGNPPEFVDGLLKAVPEGLPFALEVIQHAG